MTNREWLMEQMQNMSDEELAQVINGSVWGICKKCRQMNGDAFVECSDCKTVWLEAEYREIPKLSEAERIILENLLKEYEWICRDKNGELKIFAIRPTKNKVCGRWFEEHMDLGYLWCFKHLFQFIKWEDEQAHNIQELLEG